MEQPGGDAKGASAPFVIVRDSLNVAIMLSNYGNYPSPTLFKFTDQFYADIFV